MNKLRFILIVPLLLLWACSSKQSDYEKIESFVLKNSEIKQLANFNQVVVISSGGECLNCNLKFSRIMAKRIDDPKNIFIVSDNGSNIDISQYLDSKRKNIILDPRNNFGKLKLTNGSTLITIHNGKILKKIPINSTTLSRFK